MRKHTYVCNKGYADQYKGREVSWDVPTTIDEAVSSGAFDSPETILAYAVAQLNIKKGHAIQAATVETTIGADGKRTTTLANPNMSLADMEKIAADTNAKKSERAAKGTGGQKVAAAKFSTAKDKAKAIATDPTASPEKLATLLELGFIEQADYDAAMARINAAAPAATPTKRAK